MQFQYHTAGHCCKSTLVPAFDGYNYVGNGSNDALGYLLDATADVNRSDPRVDTSVPFQDFDNRAVFNQVSELTNRVKMQARQG